MAVTNFIWDELSDNVLLETDESDALTARYTNRPEQFGKLISQYRIEDEKIVERFYHYDGESSTSALTDSEETVTDTFIYSAYGAEVARTGTTTNPFGYKGAVGYYTNADTDDIYVRARSYEPALGCWLSPDPMGPVDGPNLYRAYFVPMGIDPSGLMRYEYVDNVFTNVCCGGYEVGIKYFPEIPVGDRNRYAVLQLVCVFSPGWINDCEVGPPSDPPCACYPQEKKICKQCCFLELLGYVQRPNKLFAKDTQAIPNYSLAGCQSEGKYRVFAQVKAFKINLALAPVATWTGPEQCKPECRQPLDMRMSHAISVENNAAIPAWWGDGANIIDEIVWSMSLRWSCCGRFSTQYAELPFHTLAADCG